MENRECEKLEQKYHELLEMLQESLKIYVDYSKKKSKRDLIFLQYKKRIYEEIQKLKQEIATKETILEEHINKNLELKKENYFLKKKFQHVSEIFSSKKENDLLSKYFPEKIKLEEIIIKTIKKLLQTKFNIKQITVLFFRKYIKIGIKDFLTQEIKVVTKSEKLAVVLSQIVLKEYSHFIYNVLAKELLNKIEVNEDFFYILIKKDLVDKTNKYTHLELKYSLDEIKKIVFDYNRIKKDDDINTISTQIEIDEINYKKEKLFNQKKELTQKLAEFEQKENELLAIIVADETKKDETKKELDKIDEEKRNVKEKIISIEEKLTKLQNRELFLKPLLEIKNSHLIDEHEKKYKEEYDKLISEFSKALKDLK